MDTKGTGTAISYPNIYFAIDQFEEVRDSLTPRADSGLVCVLLCVGVHSTAELAEAMQNKCLAQGYNLLMRAGFEPSIAASGNRHLAHMTNMLCLALVVN